jgi:hypothetical protein
MCILPTCIRKASSLNLGLDTNYPEGEFLSVGFLKAIHTNAGLETITFIIHHHLIKEHCVV